MKKILIGIPVHNAIGYAMQCIHSALFSADFIYLDYAVEILVVNDYSTNTVGWETLKAQWSHRTDIRFIDFESPNGKNPNLARILNLCLDMVGEEHDYYLNLESDVHCFSNTIQELIFAHQQGRGSMIAAIQMNPSNTLYDFNFYAMGYIDPTSQQGCAWHQGRSPKWCNLGCLLVPGDVARDKTCRADEQFDLWCVDQDYTSTVAQKYGRPFISPKALVTHHKSQSTLEGRPEGYGHLAQDAINRVDVKWAPYIAGGLF